MIVLRTFCQTVFLALVLDVDPTLGFTQEEFLVTGLGDVEPAFNSFDGNIFAGLLPIDPVSSKKESGPRGELSFMFFSPAEEKDSLTIWLNGGPGCSSFDAGMMMEVGPVTTPHYPAGHGRTNITQPLVPNNFSWTRVTNLLFVEQPAGVGFSHGPIVHDEADLSYDFYQFLVNFFNTFPAVRTKRLYIVGESYAGMYVPSIAHFIHQQNKMGNKNRINLAGIGLGNGWIDAMTQGPTVIEYAYWHGMIDSTAKEDLYEVWKHCKRLNPMQPPYHAFTIPDECNIMEMTMKVAGAGVFPKMEYYEPNAYDVTTWDKYPQLNDPHGTAYTFFNDPVVRDALHFSSTTKEWLGCAPGAGRRRLEKNNRHSLNGNTFLAKDKPASVTPYIAELLDDAGIKVLVYAGDRDLTTNLQGSEMVLDGMDWSGRKHWRAAHRFLWMVDNQVAGYVKTHKNLDMLLILNSGHLVPYNVPKPALDLITRLVSNTPFDDVALPHVELPMRQSVPSIKVEYPEPMSHRLPDGFFLISVAVVCFVCGALTSAWFVNGKTATYHQLPDVELSKNEAPRCRMENPQFASSGQYGVSYRD
jgi:carboxypeptidase C (cathepsin A)